MPKELKALMEKGQKVRDRLGQLSHEAAKVSAEAHKVLLRPDATLPDEPAHFPACEGSGEEVKAAPSR